MRSLLLVESFDLRPSNQYVLMRVIPSSFRFAKMCLCQVRLLLMCSTRYMTSSRGSCTLFIWTGGGGGHVFLYVTNVTWIDFEPESWMNMSSIEGHERASSPWCQFLLLVFLHIDGIVFWWSVKCSILRKCLHFAIYECYSWDMAFNVDLDVTFDDT
jgi:hypothetical protein